MSELNKSFLSSGHKIGIRILDSGKKENILLLHGFNDTKETFIFLEEFLSINFNIFSFDFRGHGDSDWKENKIYNSTENLLDIHNFVCNYLNEESFFLLGHSMGAGLSARYAGLFPEKIKSLILLEGFSGLQPEEVERQRIRGWLDSIAKKKSNATNRREMPLSELENKLSFIYNRLDIEKVKILVHALVEKTENNLYRWKNDPNLKTGSPIPFPSNLSRHLWKNISCPILLFFGKETQFMPNHLEEILSHFQNLTFIEIESAGHNFHHEKPEIIIDSMKSFFEKNKLLS